MPFEHHAPHAAHVACRLDDRPTLASSCQRIFLIVCRGTRNTSPTNAGFRYSWDPARLSFSRSTFAGPPRLFGYEGLINTTAQLRRSNERSIVCHAFDFCQGKSMFARARQRACGRADVVALARGG